MFTHETTEQLRTRAELNNWISIFLCAFGRTRRDAAKQLRGLAIMFPWLGDSIPDDVWGAIYRVPATGTAAPMPDDLSVRREKGQALMSSRQSIVINTAKRQAQ